MSDQYPFQLPGLGINESESNIPMENQHQVRVGEQPDPQASNYPNPPFDVQPYPNVLGQICPPGSPQDNVYNETSAQFDGINLNLSTGVTQDNTQNSISSINWHAQSYRSNVSPMSTAGDGQHELLQEAMYSQKAPISIQAKDLEPANEDDGFLKRHHPRNKTSNFHTVLAFQDEQDHVQHRDFEMQETSPKSFPSHGGKTIWPKYDESAFVEDESSSRSTSLGQRGGKTFPPRNDDDEIDAEGEEDKTYEESANESSDDDDDDQKKWAGKGLRSSPRKASHLKTSPIRIESGDNPDEEGLYDPSHPGINKFAPRNDISPIGRQVYRECLRRLNLGDTETLQNDDKNKLRESDFDIYYYKNNNARGKMTWPQVKMFVEWQHRGEPGSDVLMKVPRTIQNRYNEVRRFFQINSMKDLQNNKEFHAYGHKKANQPKKNTLRVTNGCQVTGEDGPLKRKRDSIDDIVHGAPNQKRIRTRSSDSVQEVLTTPSNGQVFWDVYEVRSIMQVVVTDNGAKATRVIDRSSRLVCGLFADPLEAIIAGETLALLWMSRIQNKGVVLSETKKRFKATMIEAVKDKRVGYFTQIITNNEAEAEVEEVDVQLKPRKVHDGKNNSSPGP